MKIVFNIKKTRNMKKIYQTPETVTTKIATTMMIAASDPNVKVDSTESVDADKVESRRNYNIWDDEEEEEF